MDMDAGASPALASTSSAAHTIRDPGLSSDAAFSDSSFDAHDPHRPADNRYYHDNRHVEKRSRVFSAVAGPEVSSSDPHSGPAAAEASSSYIIEQNLYPPDNCDFPVSISVTSTLHKQGSMRGSDSFLGEMSATFPESSANNSAKSKGTGSIFFKTKLCCKFRAGTCPYNSNCNFAHGTEELRKPPPGWEEMVAAQEAEKAMRVMQTQQAPVENSGSAVSGDNQRIHKTPRPCRKFYTHEGCPYGDRCIFMHDDQYSQGRVIRESNAISLGPMTGHANGLSNASSAIERVSSWKTRVCMKWETTGHCPFGQKCHFVHSSSEATTMTMKSVTSSKNVNTTTTMFQSQRQVQKSQPTWKGPSDEISRIYGDWIEEDEWEIPPVNVVSG